MTTPPATTDRPASDRAIPSDVGRGAMEGAAGVRVSTALDRAIDRAIGWLDRTQHPDGRWVGRLETNSCIEAEWVLGMHVLGITDDPKHPRIVRAILEQQRPDGAWHIFHGAPHGDINATVECYAALRVAGLDADTAELARARAWILGAGGLGKTRVFTRMWLALLGEWPWSRTPALPPEIIWLPPWCPLNLYDFAPWARATIAPLALLSSRRPVRPLLPGWRLDELFPGGRAKFDYRLPARPGLLTALFRAADLALRCYQALPWQPGRTAARRHLIEWIVRHQDADGAWGGIQPPWLFGILALHFEGYPLDHPVVSAGLRAFDAQWDVEIGDATYLQASESPVWDTLLALLALDECGVAPTDSPAMRRALDFVLAQEIRYAGDWSVKVPGVEPGGWAFQSHNDHYPDIDDTAVAILVLARLRRSPAVGAKVDRALSRAVGWVRAMQSKNGGWAAFEKDNTSALVTRIPFCDFGEALDPPSVDVTAHVVEALAALGATREDPAIAHALRYVLSEQEPEGSWFGRWGVNHLYGTAAVLPALVALGAQGQAEPIRRAAAWVVSKQNADGGWGESCESYMDDAQRGVGPSTASQTAWALMALVAANDRAHDAFVRRGVDYLVSRQRDDGTWDEPEYTGTGFPGYGVGRRVDLARARTHPQGRELARGFMLNYHLYRHYFPLIALGRIRRALGALQEGGHS